MKVDLRKFDSGNLILVYARVFLLVSKGLRVAADLANSRVWGMGIPGKEPTRNDLEARSHWESLPRCLLRTSKICAGR